ncbi:MAG: helix-turn-helix domain-containing protein [Planctomycetia bacterium]|nr:helix-turn-helix domain-containing protein [Planctomycetia bacterium]
MEAYRECLSISAAAHDLGIGRRTIYNWKENDEEFAEAMMDAELSALEKVQYAALQKALDGDKTMIMFLLNNKGAKLGYTNGAREVDQEDAAKAVSYLATRFVQEIDQSITGNTIEDRT